LVKGFHTDILDEQYISIGKFIAPYIASLPERMVDEFCSETAVVIE